MRSDSGYQVLGRHFHVRGRQHGADDAHGIGPGVYDRTDVIEVDATDGHHRHRDGLAGLVSSWDEVG